MVEAIDLGDVELVEAARAGDRAAFGALYDRYAEAVHDFAYSLLRDPHAADDVTQDVFVVASRRLGQLRDPAKIRAWLFSIARNEAMRQFRAATKTHPAEHLEMHVATAPDVAEQMNATEAHDLVWEAAAGLSDRDRALLDLHLRQELDGDDLADAMGVRRGTVYMMVNRLKERLDRTIGAFLVARAERGDCAELESLLAGWDGTYSVLIRKRVARHVDGCERCGRARRRLTSPMALLASVPAVPLPAELRDRVLDRVDLAAGVSSPPDRTRWRRDGFPSRRGLGRGWRAILGVAIAGAVAGGGALVALGGDDPAETAAPDGRPEPTVTAETSAPPPESDDEPTLEATGSFLDPPLEDDATVERNEVTVSMGPDDGVTGSWIIEYRFSNGTAAINRGTLQGVRDASGHIRGTVAGSTIGPAGPAGAGTGDWEAQIDDTGIRGVVTIGATRLQFETRFS